MLLYEKEVYIMTLLQLVGLPILVYTMLKVNKAVNFQVDVNQNRKIMHDEYIRNKN